MLVAERSVLVIDAIALNQSIHGMVDGMMLLFATYYCFNIQYPHELAATLEFIQRNCASYNTIQYILEYILILNSVAGGRNSQL